MCVYMGERERERERESESVRERVRYVCYNAKVLVVFLGTVLETLTLILSQWSETLTASCSHFL